MTIRPHQLIIEKANENNLKQVSLEIPHDQLVVVTGLSGSGKSSLAFETVYAEGQRRYIETFSPYTRQFFDKVKKPDAERIDNVRPAIAIQQRTKITSSRSTVGSLTNINDYLKILWFNVARPNCPACHIELRSWLPKEVSEWLLAKTRMQPRATFLICAHLEVRADPVVAGSAKKPKKATKKSTALKAAASALRSEQVDQLRSELLSSGYSRYFCEKSGRIKQLEALSVEDFEANARLLLVLDRVRFSDEQTVDHFSDPIQQSFNFAFPALETFIKTDGGTAIVETIPEGQSKEFLRIVNNPAQKNSAANGALVHLFWPHFRCPENACAIPRARQALFSFNHPLGACPDCKGFGHILGIDEKLCVPNPNLTIKGKAVQCWAGNAAKAEYKELLTFCQDESIDINIPWRDLPDSARHKIFHTKTKTYWGVLPWFQWLERKTYKMHVRVFLSRYRSPMLCPTCHGSRLKPEALSFRVLGRSLADAWQMPIAELHQWLLDVEKTFSKQAVWTPALQEVVEALDARLRYLVDLGLSYLTLDRPARTLSGGETQRVNLASALGSELVSTQFVLDEPSVGLHARDTSRLIKAIEHLARKGNSVLMVEHDLDCITAADWVIEMGPQAGSHGGEVVFNGTSQTWPSLDLSRQIPAEESASEATSNAAITIEGARARNLKDVSVKIPLGKFVCLSGVSGSGKSTLAHEVLFKAYQNYQLGLLNNNVVRVDGFQHVGQVLIIDQSALSRSPRANIATYTGIWDEVRNLLANSEDAQTRALSKSAFSFNVDGGRCPECKGAGFIREDMQFLSDVYVPCQMCLGKRFQPAVLEVRYQERSVSEILNMTVAEARTFFADRPSIQLQASLLSELGLGHLTLGHALSELSGGEAQRLKLVPFIAQAHNINSLLIFDEPTTGLHFYDVQQLILLLRRLTKLGHSVLCIEHNLSLLAACDWIIDLGPEGGAGGGYLLLEGPPRLFYEQSSVAASATAKFLKEFKEQVERFSAPRGKTKQSKELQQVTSLPRAQRLTIKGAREHNLKNINVSVPLDSMVALCGVSGSGKSTIAKDIIYAEGQRRYLDCLSPYARQYIKELSRPDIDEIQNVRPTVCVYQHTYQPSRLSTVATMSEVYNFLRLLYAKTGIQYCPDHPDQQISPLSAAAMATLIKQLPAKNIRLLAPIIKLKKGTHRAVFQRAMASEISQVRVDGVFLNPELIETSGGLEKAKAHSIDFVVARFNPSSIPHDLLQESIAQGLSLSGGTLIAVTDGGTEIVYSTERSCPVCKRGFFKADPEDLSFNSKRGVCEKCEGSGKDKKGLPCAECGGARINALGRNIRINGLAIHEVCNKTTPDVVAFLESVQALSPALQALAEPIVREALGKVRLLSAMGLDYVQLSRDCTSLSGGELQRLRLAAAVGSSLSGAMFIFDEPSAGLHPVDNTKVLSCLRTLCDHGNSVIVIEHDPDSIVACDHIIDIGPEGGKGGGEVVFSGSTKEFLESETSPTSLAIRNGSGSAPLPERKGTTSLRVTNASANNLKNVAVEIPLHRLVTVAGVSGAGKSSLVHSVVRTALEEGRSKGSVHVHSNGTVETDEAIERLLEVDQKPIGINSRSTPASYLKVWDEIRKLFAETNDAKARGWDASFFSYNSGKGRCSECGGLGQRKLEMSFLPDAKVECELCEGSRFSDEALRIRYLGLNPADVLRLTFEEAKSIFANHRRIHRVMRLACELGLGYLSLGQSSTTLSGGESQRIKLVSELSTPSKGHTLYILDEPTTGLHKRDVERLLVTLRQLVDLGNTVLVIEHDKDVLLGSDHVIEMGPGPAEKGGNVIFSGSPTKLPKAKTPWGQTLRATAEQFPAVSVS